MEKFPAGNNRNAAKGGGIARRACCPEWDKLSEGKLSRRKDAAKGGGKAAERQRI